MRKGERAVLFEDLVPSREDDREVLRRSLCFEKLVNEMLRGFLRDFSTGTFASHTCFIPARKFQTLLFFSS